MSKNSDDVMKNDIIKNEMSEEEVPNKGTPYEEVQIYDTSSNKIRKARNFKLSSYEEYDQNGEISMEKSVEFIIVGNQNTWKMFIPYMEFKKSNPHVDIPGDVK
jgi:hypothetical protein